MKTLAALAAGAATTLTLLRIRIRDGTILQALTEQARQQIAAEHARNVIP